MTSGMNPRKHNKIFTNILPNFFFDIITAISGTNIEIKYNPIPPVVVDSLVVSHI